MECLESRALLSGVNPIQVALSSGSAGAPGTASPTGLTPQQVRHAYGFDQIKFNAGAIAGDGSGTTIAIVDAFDDPNVAHDLLAFQQAFFPGAPAPSLTKIEVDQNGHVTSNVQAAAKYDSSNPSTTSFAIETALDVEWAYAIAPRAHLLLVEAQDAAFPSLMAAVDYARQAPGVIAVSMSFGTADSSGETSFDGHFTTPAGHAGVTFVAASGDRGAPALYPATSPNVIAVGGTTVNLDGNGNLLGPEAAWTGSGGGFSSVEPQPGYQSGIVSQGTAFRATPDVAYAADGSQDFSVYDSYDYSAATPWSQWGGTSAGAPQWTALVAVADQGRALAGRAALDGAKQALPALYSLPASDFNDITTGQSVSQSGSSNYSAGAGYDLATGRGTPKAKLIVNDLLQPAFWSLDPRFGTFIDQTAPHYGKIATNVTGTASDSGYAVALQSNGDFVVAGTENNANPTSDIIVARYRPDGSLDTSFGTNGVTTTNFGSSAVAQDVAVQPDGKIVVVGWSGVNSAVFAVMRLNSDGTFDNSFGAGGVVTTDISAKKFDEARSVVLQGDGKIVVAGSTNDGFPTGDFALVRYNSDGSRDTGFGSQGIVVTDFGAHDIASAVALQADGKIVVGGLTSTGSPTFGLARYNINGSLDSTFGIGGKVSTLFSGANSQSIRAMAIQADGKIVVAGDMDTSYFGKNNFAVARYNANGSLDTTFNGTGTLTTDFGGHNDAASAVAIQSDGKIVVGGQTDVNGNLDFALARYDANGALDGTFFTGGKVVTSFGASNESIQSLAITPTGDILAAGSTNVANGGAIAVARYAQLPGDFRSYDSTAPVSSVSSLPPITNTASFTVSWNAVDEAGGSGVHNVSVYLSDDGAVATPFVVDSTSTSALFTGQFGHTYSFYSVATDNAGNVEAAPVKPDAATTLRDTPVDTTSATTWNAVSGQSTGNTVLATFTDDNPAAIQSDYSPTVDWGGTLTGTPSVSVVLVSSSATATNWEVVGNATYAATGNFTVKVTVADSDGSNVQTGQTHFNVSTNSLPPAFLFAGQYGVAIAGNGTPTLATISQNGAQLTLNGTGIATASIVVGPAQLLMNGAVAATYGNSTLTFTSGPFAGQTWTKLDLPENFTNLGGDTVEVTSSGSSLTFAIPSLNVSSAGSWISPTQVSAFGQTGAVGAGKITWSGGNVWTENLVINGSIRPAGASTNSPGTATIAASLNSFVTDYANLNGYAAHVFRTGTSLTFVVDPSGTFSGATSPGSWISPTQVAAFGQIGTVDATGSITWSGGQVWTGLSLLPLPATTNCTNLGGAATHIVQNGVLLTFVVDASGDSSPGYWISPTQVFASAFGQTGTVRGNKITWSGGNVWTAASASVAPPNFTNYTNLGGAATQVVQNGTSLTFVVDPSGTSAGATSPGTWISPTQVAGFGQTGTISGSKIIWSGGNVWTAASVIVASPNFISYTNLAGNATHVVQNGTWLSFVVDAAGVSSAGYWISPTQVYAPAFSQTGTISGSQIIWSGGNIWSGTTNLRPSPAVVIALTDTNGAVSYVQLTSATTLVAVDGALAGMTATRQNNTLVWSNGDVWNNFDFDALNALFEMATGYP